MNLKTKYLGLDLRTPLVASASPLSREFDNLKRLEDAGASAVVFHSLFEEQLRRQTSVSEGPANGEESRDYFPEADEFNSDPRSYLSSIVKAKEALDIPVIASLNGSTFGGWMKFAREMEEAGADALELNIYSIPTDSGMTADDIETDYLTIIASIKAQLKIPVAVKLSPFFTNLGYFARRLDQQNVDGLVLFNRFYQPDIDLDAMVVSPTVNLSAPGEIRLPLRWIALLRGRVRASLAATSGIHRGSDALKLLMAGADATMLCSVLLRRGIEHVAVIEKEIHDWMGAHSYDSLEKLKGCMSQERCGDPSAFERAQYVRAIGVDRAIQPSL